jgi:2-C-methyl-D-erythritol 2,4-cyclodiphosphate synthase
MRESIAALLGAEVSRVSVKASSGNGLTAFGRGEGIAAEVVVLVERPG